VIDLTERKRAEEGLRRSQAWLTQAQMLSRTGTWVYDATKKEILQPSSGSYYPMERSNTSNQPLVISFPRKMS
jgi:hypothetical protein